MNEDIYSAVTVREYKTVDLPQMRLIWNEVVAAGRAFPQEEELDDVTCGSFFGSQTKCGVAEDSISLVGLYILHPNNVGRCGHIANASYAVRPDMRGRHIGELLVRHCMAQARSCGFKILQFNAVVENNLSARRLYERLGFVQLGTIPKGFRMKNGAYENICPYYIEL